MKIDEKNLKCPFCEKDVNIKWIEKEIEVSSSKENPMFYSLLRCHHCKEAIFFLFEGLTILKKSEIQRTITSYAMITKRNSFKPKPAILNLKDFVDKESKLIYQYPFRKTIFRIKGIPSKVKESLIEAEKCFSIGAKNGCAACLRKCIYALCDDLEKVKLEKESTDYIKKIERLFPEQNEYSELTKHIKWLGDKHVHNINEESYTYNHVKQALDITPLIIKEIYEKKDKVKNVKNILNQSLQKTKK